MIFTLIVVGVAVGPVRWEPPNLWSTEFGTTGPGVGNRVTSLSVDAGGLYAAGYVGELGMVSVNATPSQLFVTRYDLSRRQVWSEALGSPEGSDVNGVAGGADGVYLVGNLNGTGFVKKYGLQGNLAWTSNFASSSSVQSNAYDVSVGTAGVYVIASNLFSNSSRGLTLRAFDFEGNVLWTQSANGLGGHNVYAARSGLYVSGIPFNGSSGFVRRYDFSGVPQWTRQFTCLCWPNGVSGDGTGIYVAGQDFLGTFSQAFVAKYDWDGNQVWMREFRPPNTEVDNLSMSANPSGVYIAMITKIGNYLSKYDGNGNSVWLFRIPLSPYAVSAVGSSVYVGGDTGAEGRNAALSQFGQSSSLIFFGLIPPFSFLVVSVLIATATISILWLRRGSKSKVRLPVRSNPSSKGFTCEHSRPPQSITQFVRENAHHDVRIPTRIFLRGGWWTTNNPRST